MSSSHNARITMFADFVWILPRSRYDGVMKLLRGLLSLVVAVTSLAVVRLDAAEGKTRVLVVTGGHDFEKEPFFKLFKDNPDITFRSVEHPKAHALLGADAAKDWDVLVLYDMYQPITEEAKSDFVSRLKEGKGLVVLHHAIASYQKWPEYAKIIGAKYYLEDTVVDGIQKKRSQWQHDVKIPIQIADPGHPVTHGLKDFVIHDETYNLFDVASDNHVLLTGNHPLSNKVLSWAKTYEKSRVVYVQLGHDHFAYEDPNYVRLVRQAIQWVAPKK